MIAELDQLKMALHPLCKKIQSLLEEHGAKLGLERNLALNKHLNKKILNTSDTGMEEDEAHKIDSLDEMLTVAAHSLATLMK